MNTTTWTASTALVLSMLISSPVMAQERTIGGVSVPESQWEEIQQRCDELRAAELGAAPSAASGAAAGAMTAQTPGENAPAPDAPAAGASNDPETVESAAEAPVEPAPEPAVAGADGGNMAADTPDEEFDMATLTVAMCDEGGFTAAPPQ